MYGTMVESCIFSTSTLITCMISSGFQMGKTLPCAECTAPWLRVVFSARCDAHHVHDIIWLPDGQDSSSAFPRARLVIVDARDGNDTHVKLMR
jgi:hypothetical protein